MKQLRKLASVFLKFSAIYFVNMIRATNNPNSGLSDADRMIGLRVMYARHSKKLSQTILAERVGVTQIVVSTIESGRVALRLDLGWKICKVLDIHPSWLCRGAKEENFPAGNEYLNYAEDYVAANPTSLFSKSWPAIAWVLGPDHPVTPAEAQERELQEGQALKRKRELARNRMIASAEKENAQNQGLTIAPTSENMSSMKRELQAVLSTAKKLTQGRGEKSKLAKYLGVSTSRISEWLAGKTEPGGQATLALLRWVEKKQAHK